MIDGKPGWQAILRINVRMVAALLVLGYGWLCWRISSPQMWGFGLVALMCGLGGALHLVGTIWQVAALVRRHRKLRDFREDTGRTRGDRLARPEDLKARGMIR